MPDGLARTLCRFGSLAAAGLLLASPVPALAQQQYRSPEQASINPPKPAPAKKRAPEITGLSSYWSNPYETPIQGGLQRRQSDVMIREPTRVPLQDGSGGTIGFAATRSSTATLYDGSAVPGINPNTRNSDTSGAGLSITVPRSDNFLLAPATILGGPPTW